MPVTRLYGLPYEHPVSDEPGRTLHGGLDGTAPILAEAVEGELARIDRAMSGFTDAVAALSSVAPQVIDEIHSGAGTNTTAFTNIPQTFEHLVIVWYGEHNGGDTIVSLGLRFNGDGGANYISQRIDSRQDAISIDASDTFSILRVGIVGRFTGSGGSIIIPHYSTAGVTKSAFGDAYGRDLIGGEYRGWGHGRWASTAAITSVRIWPSGQLWESTPHMVLLGVPGRTS